MVIHFDNVQLESLCSKWKIVELALFGSALTDRFRATSDIDVVVTFAVDAPWNLWDLSALRLELAELFGRPVDLLEKQAIQNPFVRHEILSTLRVIYAA